MPHSRNLLVDVPKNEFKRALLPQNFWNSNKTQYQKHSTEESTVEVLHCLITFNVKPMNFAKMAMLTQVFHQSDPTPNTITIKQIHQS